MATFSPDRQSTGRPLTIGTVCRRLKEEFPDISISKIRYLEDQGLLTPRRTQGGYRLFTEDDFERLQTILRLQRDEFLPLRVIRQELSLPSATRRGRKRPGADSGLRAPEQEVDFETLCERSGADPKFVRELEEFGLLEPWLVDGERRFGERDIDIASACVRLSRYGAEPRNLRKFRTGADNKADLLQQIVAPGLRSVNAELRQHAYEDLEVLAGAAQELSQLLFRRALRSLVAR